MYPMRENVIERRYHLETVQRVVQLLVKVVGVVCCSRSHVTCVVWIFMNVFLLQMSVLR